MAGFTFFLIFVWLGVVTWRMRDLIREVHGAVADSDRGGHVGHVAVRDAAQDVAVAPEDVDASVGSAL